MPVDMRAKRSMTALASSGAKSIAARRRAAAGSSAALARAAARLERAHRLERLAHHALELGQRGDAAVSSRTGVRSRTSASATRRSSAGFSRASRGTGRRPRPRQPLELELAQPPQLHPLGEHRVHAADVGPRRLAVARERAHVDARRARARTRRARRARQLGVGERGREVAAPRAAVDVGEQPLALGQLRA
jgi:hypothetical protein